MGNIVYDKNTVEKLKQIEKSLKDSDVNFVDDFDELKIVNERRKQTSIKELESIAKKVAKIFDKYERDMAGRERQEHGTYTYS